MTENDILKSRFSSPEDEPSKGTPKGSSHVEPSLIDMMDRLIDGGLVVENAGGVRLVRGEKHRAGERAKKNAGPPDDPNGPPQAA